MFHLFEKKKRILLIYFYRIFKQKSKMPNSKLKIQTAITRECLKLEITIEN